MAELKNLMREMFCRHYITEIDGRPFNATKAALKAGYSEKSAYSQGQRLLKNVEIINRILELMKASMDRTDLDADYVINRFKKIVEDDISNYLKFGMYEKTYISIDDEGNQIEQKTEEFQIIGKNSDEIDTWNISEVSQGKDGTFKFKLHCKDKALSKLGEYLSIAEGMKSKNNTPTVIINNDLPGGDKIG